MTEFDPNQVRMVALLNEMSAALREAGIEMPDTKVTAHDPSGKFMHDWLAAYDRGRRSVSREGNVRVG